MEEHSFCPTCQNVDGCSDEIEKELGEDFYEIKRLVSGGYCAYSITDRALGQTFKEAMENLLKIVKEKHR